ncbi:hypothetical protein [Rhodopseudomonas palustris]|uniref:hypothetical protein n=1 Tax=Rhodopseudomonas palustris TaxID=1076 RepID=UPI000CECCC79|nr:hypothetical protein [Rhodopseudomonas palustris]PPQ42126.1 hypothetical protein CKO39_18220 [Rhodopseudomonas palustris]
MELNRSADELATELILAGWSLTMMAQAFEDLALAFAKVDPAAADKAIHAIEVLAADSLTKFTDHPPEGVALPRQALVPVAQNFRQMTQGARQAIRDAAKPPN